MGKVVPLADLVQEGCIALIRSAELYDPEKGAKFTTYAWRAVVSACRRGATPANSIVKIPDRLRLASAKLRKFRESYIQQFGEEPSESTQQAQTKERLALIRKSENVRRGVDLDAAVGKDGQSTVMDVMVCQRSGPEEVVAQEMMRADVRDACYRSLPKRWADVVALRYGLNDGEPVVAKEVGKSFGISEVRVGQIVLQALEKLRKLEPDLLEHIYEL